MEGNVRNGFAGFDAPHGVTDLAKNSLYYNGSVIFNKLNLT